MVSDARESELRRRIEKGSTELDDYWELGRLLETSGRWEELLALLRKALELTLPSSERARTLISVGWGLYELTGEYSQAHSVAQSAISLLDREPDSTELLLLRGVAFSLAAQSSEQLRRDSGREAAAQGLTLLEKAIAKQNSLDNQELVLRAIYEAAQLHGLLGHFDQAVEYCRRCLGHAKDDQLRLDCLTVLAGSLRQAGKSAEAEGVLKEALQYVKVQPSILLRLYSGISILSFPFTRKAMPRTLLCQPQTALASLRW